MYTMTGLYSEAGDDSSIDVPPEDSEASESFDRTADVAANNGHTSGQYIADTVIKCHSRQPSSGVVDREKTLPNARRHEDDIDDLSRDCGLLGCRPAPMQKFARIKVCSKHFPCPIFLKNLFLRTFTDIRAVAVHVSNITASFKLGLH